MPEITSSRYLVQAGWADVPHLDDKTQAELASSFLPHERDARVKGEPALGSGAIYPVPQSDIECDPFVIPAYWPRAYAMDVGWARTAVLWGAWDRSVDVMYLYAEHYAGQAVPPVHAEAIKARGAWIPGVIDPAARGRQQADGTQMIATYRDLGLVLSPAVNTVDAGIYEVWQRMVTGRLKVFRVLQNFWKEYRLYRRDEKGRIVKEHDHCLAPHTLVITRRGRIPIAELVGTEGEVLTDGGRWTRFRNVRQTQKDAAIVTVEFDDGSSVQCTPDHRFRTPDGWVQAIDLQGRFVHDAVSERIMRRASWSQSSPARSKNSRGTAITSAASISSARAFGFIGRFGNVCMGALSRMAFMSITSMGTSATTIPGTCNYSPAPSISRFTRQGTIEASPMLRSLRLPSGTAQKPGWNGIGNTTRTSRTRSIAGQRRLASNAAAPSSRLIARMFGSAQTLARRAIASCLAWMTRIASASSAKVGSGRTDTSANRHARPHAARRCLRVSDAGRSSVYCMEVPETSAFAVENGVVVHNCMDAMRYLVMSGPSVAKVKTPDRVDIIRPAVGDRQAGY